ncbi:beta-lactamase-like protein [Coemansia spiralis]|nr:beta-lactamase-like protein [Coemansia spiralis]
MLLEIEKTQLTPERKGPVDGYTFVYDDHSSTQDSQLELHRPQKALPAYKKIPGTSFTVDAFKYGHVDFCSAYFLTHFHSDHYGGLTRSFAGHIYCPRITANCVVNIIGVKPTYVHALPMNTRCIVHGVYVTLLDAEHCPGACIILFEIPDRQNGQDVTRIVHTGDFRASSRHISQIAHGPGLSLNCDFAIDSVYLDTTYLEPKYSFPQQSRVVSVVGDAKSRVLFVVGTYSIGKERLFIEIARQIGSKIHANAQKRRIIECISSSSLQSMLADDMLKAQVHAVPMSQVNMRGMTQHLEMLQKKGAPFTRIVAFSPTGWSHAGPYIPGPIEHEASPDTRPIPKLKPRGSSSCITIFPVPYSEHSSFAELARFICSLNIKQIIPTVFSGNDTKNTMANDWLRHWQELKAEYQKRAKELAGSPAESSCRLPHRPACPVTFCPNDPY